MYSLTISRKTHLQSAHQMPLFFCHNMSLFIPPWRWLLINIAEFKTLISHLIATWVECFWELMSEFLLWCTIGGKIVLMKVLKWRASGLLAVSMLYHRHCSLTSSFHTAILQDFTFKTFWGYHHFQEQMKKKKVAASVMHFWIAFWWKERFVLAQ